MDVTLNLMAGINGITCIKHITQWLAFIQKNYINVSSLLLNPSYLVDLIPLFSLLSLGRASLFTVFYCTLKKSVNICLYILTRSWSPTYLGRCLTEQVRKSRRCIVGHGPVWASPRCCQSTRPHAMTHGAKLSWGSRQFCITGLLEYWEKAPYSLLSGP